MLAGTHSPRRSFPTRVSYIAANHAEYSTLEKRLEELKNKAAKHFSKS